MLECRRLLQRCWLTPVGHASLVALPHWSAVGEPLVLWVTE